MFSILFPVYNLVLDVMALWSKQTIADWHAMGIVEHTLSLLIWVRIVTVGVPVSYLFYPLSVWSAADDYIPLLF